jgi:predicted AAA+ superfamily ATPase
MQVSLRYFVALPCYNVTEPVPPLESNGRHSLFKLFLNDVGLLCAASMGNIQYDLLQGNLDVNMGAIMEDVVAQELRAHGFDLHYYNSTRLGEVDFVVQNGKTVLPIEVKSGNDWRRHKALDNMLAIDDWHLRDAYVFCKGNVDVDGPITYLPLYMTMFLKPERLPESLIYMPDLSALR